VHSIAAGLLLKKDEIHFFNDIAYYHVPFTHCPLEEDLRIKNKCHCNPDENFDWNGYSCKKCQKLTCGRTSANSTSGTGKFYEFNKMQKPKGWEKHT